MVTLEGLSERVKALETAEKENRESHGEIYARLNAVERGHAVLDTSLTNIWTVLKEIQADVKDLKDRPAKKWDTIVSEAIKWLVVAALGAMVVFK